MDQIFESFNLNDMFSTILPKILTSAAIFIAAIIVTKLVGSLLSRWQKLVLQRVQRKDPRSYSSVSTRFTIIKRIIMVSIYFFAFILFFLQFEALRSLGTGLLASAGVAGVVIGMAAQSTLSDVLAGISISFAQPVRLGDAVIFDNEFGWIEEIALMHIIIKTWDNRRIVVPNNVFSTKIIQNWTMSDASLLGV